MSEELKEIAARSKRIETRVSMLAVALGVELAGAEPTFQLTQPATANGVVQITTHHKHFTMTQLVKFMRSCDVHDADVEHPAGYRLSVQLD